MSTKKPRNSRQSHRSTLSLTRTEIIINVYDLLPPGRISSLLWTVGSSLLHTGVVINGREYAYGGHDRPGATGVYWTPPRTCPPGGTFRLELLHGFTFAPAPEIDQIVHATSQDFPGPAYNLLSRNCNHFTQALCERLTGRRGPAWLNRAAAIGVALPCVVPRDWVEPPDYAGGEEDDSDLDAHEHTGFLSRDQSFRGAIAEQHETSSASESGSEAGASHDGGAAGEQQGHGYGVNTKTRDSSGRPLPPAERAPVPAAGS